MKRWGSALSGAVCAALLVVFVVTLVIWMIAGDAAGMARAMSVYAPADETGLPADDYGAAADMICGYLTGQRDEFSFTLVDGAGEEYEAFNDRERAHMADCRDLIDLDRRVCILSLGIAVIVMIAAAVKGANRRTFGKGGLCGLGALFVIAAGLTVWALVNFDGLFVTFHRVAFRNDLWLLNPRTDLLIRLMPEELFVHLGEKGALPAAAGAVLVTMGFVRMKFSCPERSEGRTDY